jgi:hypothetical protein
MTNSTIIGWGVYYAPTKQGKLFAGLKYELQDCFKNERDALVFKNHLNMAGRIDELHSGYVVYSLQWLPKGFQLK